MSDALRILLLLLGLVGAAFFAGMETGVISINRLRLRHLVQHKVRGAAVLEDFLKRPDLLLGTTLVGTNLCHVIVAVLATSLSSRLPWAWAPTVAGILMTLIILVFNEYLPKAWFQSLPHHRTLPFAWALEVSARVLAPLRWIIVFIVRLLVGRKAAEQAQQPFVTREELLHLAAEGGQSGALTPNESRMIRGVFDLSGIRCRDIMVSRDRIVSVPADMPAAEMTEFARSRIVNRFPVWDATQKKFLGFVHIFDVLSDAESGGKVARDYMRPPQFVAEATLVDHVMPRMRVTRQPLILVTNDKHEVTGLLTLNDVLDVIVGASEKRAAK